jgi:ribosomal protein S20
MGRLLRHKLVIGIAALVAAGGAGGAYAASQSGSNPRQAFLNDVARRLNVPPSKLQAALRGALLDRLDAAVKAGRLTQAEADRLKKRIESGRLPFFGPRGRFGPGERFIGPRHGPISTAARYLGLTDRQLLMDLAGGKTLAQIARAQGKSVSGLEQALLAAAKTRLDRLVTAGLITKDQEQRHLRRLKALVHRGLPRFHPGALPVPVPGPGLELPGPPPPGGPGFPPPGA